MSDWEEDHDAGISFSQPINVTSNGMTGGAPYGSTRGGGDDRSRGRNRGRGGNYRNNGYGDYDDNNKANGGNPFQRGGTEGRSFGNRGGGGSRGSGRGSGRRMDGGDRKPNLYQGNDPSMDNVKTEKPREIYVPPMPTENEEEIFSTTISSGINFDKLQEIAVKVTGENPPSSVEQFSQTGLNSQLLQNVTKSGYRTPTPIQKHAIPIIMQRRDLMGCAQTGSGKTAAFLLPIINSLLDADCNPLNVGKPHAVIVTPTRELTIQISNEARKFAHNTGLKINVAYGGTSRGHQRQQLDIGCHVLVATPGRLNDFVVDGVIGFDDIKFVVLDEADRMLDMGFRGEIEKVMHHRTMVNMKDRQTLMFSATFPEEIQELAGKYLDNYIFIAVGVVGGACSDVEQTIHQVARFGKRKKLEEILGKDNPRGTLVFVETKRNADYLASLMSETKFPTTSIHGDRLQREREQALADFKSGRMFVLIATSVAARGLDIKNVSHVVNYDLPKGIDDYVHRIGRTGRVGNKGRATSFYDPEQDAAIAPDLVRILTQAGQPVPEFLGTGRGGTFNGQSRFGGHDIRDVDGSRFHAQPVAFEPEEEW